jgi:DNA-binding transcriptional ArsR family regulator
MVSTRVTVPMADADAADFPLDAAVGAAGPHTTEAFALLGNETRLAILLALWEAYDPATDDNVVSFSELYEQIDYDNAGNFSYHLDQLVGMLIRKRLDPEGYELRDTGLALVKTVIAGAGVADTSLDPVEIDRPCSLCGGTTAVSYEDGVLYQVCTDCDGISTDPALPDGYLNATPFHPAGLADRSPAELVAAAEVAAYRHIQTMVEGICSACSGPVEARLETCSDHDSDGICENCGRVHAFWARFQCRVCKDHHVTTPAVLTVFHPAVIAFYHEHGVSPRWHAREFEGLPQVGEDEVDHQMVLTSEVPPRVEVTVCLDGDELGLTFDETVAVVNVNW